MKDEYSLYRRTNSKIWQFTYYIGSKRKYKSTGKKKKKEAKEFIENFLKKSEQKKISLYEYTKNFFIWNECTWIKRQHKKGKSFSRSTAKDRRAHLVNHILPEFGHIFLDNFNPVKIENWLLNLSVSNQTKNHILYTMNIIFKEAKRERLIKQNPIDDIDPLSKNHKKADAFSLNDLRILFPENKERLIEIWQKIEYATMFMLMVTSGIRLGETRALQWKHISWKHAAVFILQAWKADKTLGEPKAKEKRGIYLPDRTMDLLQEWKSKSIFTFPDDLIFYGEDRNKPINNKTVYKYFMKGVDKAGINQAGKNYKPHSLRHTYNTIMRGILTEDMLREFTGHRSEVMTDHYDSRDFLEERLEKNKRAKFLINEVFTLKRL